MLTTEPTSQVGDPLLTRLRASAPALGITRLATLTGLDTIGVPVVQAVRPGSRLITTAQGKGLTQEHAEIAAIMEAVEHHAAERHRGPLLFGRREEIGERALDCASLGIPPELPIFWGVGTHLFTGETVWVPWELVHTRYTVDSGYDPKRFTPTTNGLGAGESLIQALVHALGEVVERDGIEWLSGEFVAGNRALEAERRLDLGTVKDTECLEILDRCAQADVAVTAWDATTSLGVSTCRVLVQNRKDDPWRVIPAALGMGADLTPEAALRRALLEACQSRLTLIAGSRDDLPPASYRRTQAGAEAFREEAGVEGRRSLAEMPVWEGDPVAVLLGRLEAAGITDGAVVDLTTALDIPVVRVMVPWLRPPQKRW
jgi:YcaO-like protein with predicted kinase domain